MKRPSLYLRTAALPFLGGFLYYNLTHGPKMIAYISLAVAFFLILTARIVDFINRRKAEKQN